MTLFPNAKKLTDVLDKADLLHYFETRGLTPKEALIACKFYIFICDVRKEL